MIRIQTIKELRDIIKIWRKCGLSIGFVPTMGYLHEGHVSLIVRAAAENDRVIVSDFVNPMQFGPSEDLESYPRDLERDAVLCEEAGADILFHPSKEEMYLDTFSTFVDMTGPTELLCGQSRPIHFRGVCTVVAKLFLITTPDRAYFGKKDAQQLAVIKRMVQDLNFDIEVIGCPIIREDDGLAKSSRNVYLSQEERRAAVILHKALTEGEELIRGGETDVEAILSFVKNRISTEPLAQTEYVELVSFPGIQRVETAEGSILVAVAVRFGTTRLIDNFIIEQEERTC